MKREVPKYYNRGRLDVPSERQKSLGLMLLDGRKAKGWSRTALSEATGINPNSIAKYEQAGIDEDDGRYPNSSKLAMLCFALGLDPMETLLACLPKNDFGMYEQLSANQAGIYNHPQMRWIEQQLEISLRENMLFKNYFELLHQHISTENMSSDEIWLAEEGAKLVSDYHNLEARFLQLGIFYIPYGSLYHVSSCMDEAKNTWMYGLKSKAVADENKHRTNSVGKSLLWYASRFVSLAEQYGNLKAQPQLAAKLEDFKFQLEYLKQREEEWEQIKKSSEDALAASPSSKSTLPDQKSEVDDG